MNGVAERVTTDLLIRTLINLGYDVNVTTK